VISLGQVPDDTRIWRKLSGQSLADVRDKLQPLHEELSKGRVHLGHLYGPGVRRGLAGQPSGWPTGQDGVDLPEVLEPLVALIGAAKLMTLSAGQVRSAPVTVSADRPTWTLQLTRNSVCRAIKQAEADDLAGETSRRW
jgi:hypothetical protein